MNELNENKSLRERMEEYNSPVNNDLFSKLDINQKQDNKPYLVYLFIAICAILILGGIYTYYTSKKSKIEVENTSISSIKHDAQSVLVSPFKIPDKNPDIFNRRQIVDKSSLNNQRKVSNVEDKLIGKVLISNENGAKLKKSKTDLESIEVESALTSEEMHRDLLQKKRNTEFDIKELFSTAFIECIDQYDIEIIRNEEFSGPKCPRIEKLKNFRKSIEINFGLLSSVRFFERNNLFNEPINYIDNREGSEKILQSYHIGVLLRSTHRSGLGIASGLDYQINEELFENISGKERKISVKEIFDAQGNIIRVDTIETIGYRHKKVYNRFHIISIPLYASYQHWIGDFYIQPEIGISAGILVGKRGEILDENHNYYSIGDDSKKYFDKLFHFQSNAKLSIGYLFKNEIEIQISPEYQYTITPLNSSTAPANQNIIVLVFKQGLISL